MSDPLWLPDVLRAEGLLVEEYPGWRERGHGDFGEIWGVMCHHTGNNPPANNPGSIANHPTLGLCSQLHLSRAGVYTVCGAGIAWHAGIGSYPGLPADDANRLTIGIEAENNGTEGWSDAQYGAYVRGAAAILRRLHQPATHVIGHKEWAAASQGKWDPGGIDMNLFRAGVARYLTEGGTSMSAAEVQELKNYIDVRVTNPIGSDVKDIRQQLAGARDAGQYPGWPQLGGKTVVDALAEILTRLDRIERRNGHTSIAAITKEGAAALAPSQH